MDHAKKNGFRNIIKQKQKISNKNPYLGFSIENPSANLV